MFNLFAPASASTIKASLQRYIEDTDFSNVEKVKAIVTTDGVEIETVYRELYKPDGIVENNGAVFNFGGQDVG